MISQLIISTSAWPATVYKSAHDLQEQNDESCMIYSGILKQLHEYVFAATHVILLASVSFMNLSKQLRTK